MPTRPHTTVVFDFGGVLRLAGWQTIHVTDPLTALTELDALLTQAL